MRRIVSQLKSFNSGSPQEETFYTFPTDKSTCVARQGVLGGIAPVTHEIKLETPHSTEACHLSDNVKNAHNKDLSVEVAYIKKERTELNKLDISNGDAINMVKSEKDLPQSPTDKGKGSNAFGVPELSRYEVTHVKIERVDSPENETAVEKNIKVEDREQAYHLANGIDGKSHSKSSHLIDSVKVEDTMRRNIRLEGTQVSNVDVKVEMLSGGEDDKDVVDYSQDDKHAATGRVRQLATFVTVPVDFVPPAGSLKNDMKDVKESGRKPYSCKVCQKEFNGRCSLQYHARKHSGEKRFSCDVCTKAFISKSSLQKHMTMHSGERQFSCGVCTKSFIQKSHLTTHLKIHSGEKAFSCEICSKPFIAMSDLRKHLRTHSDAKPFTCDICSKSFTQRGNLLTHMKIHSGARPFTCDICQKSFTHLSEFQKHLRIHSGERPYKCNVCSKAFSQKSCLHTHLRIHSGEKPFKCMICTKSFNQKSNLKSHLRVHSNQVYRS